MTGDVLKKIRENRGLTTDQLSEKADIPLNLIKDIEEGLREASPKTIGKLIEVLEIKESELNDSKAWETVAAKDIGDRIKAMREKNELSLNELGKMAGISLTYLSEIERGNMVPPIETVRNIAGLFNVPVSLFLAEKKSSLIIAEKMKKARKKRGMTQKDLAIKAGVSAGLIGQLELGSVNASFKTLKKISEVLGVSVCYLILDQEEVEEIIGGLSPHLRNLLYDEQVQLIIGSICTLDESQLKMALNFINMLKNPSFAN